MTRNRIKKECFTVFIWEGDNIKKVMFYKLKGPEVNSKKAVYWEQ